MTMNVTCIIHKGHPHQNAGSVSLLRPKPYVLNFIEADSLLVHLSS